MADLVPVRPTDPIPAYAPPEMDSARCYRNASRAAGTRAKYEADWRAFSAQCAERGHSALPAHPGATAVYLSALADRRLPPSTVGRILGPIGHRHQLAGLVAPHRAEGGAVVAGVLAGPRRRDRALLSFGMAAALRRSELVALTVADLERGPDEVRVRLRVGRSKTDQEGRGVVIAVPDGRRLKPVEYLDAWLARAGIGDGPVFQAWSTDGSALAGQSVSLIVKRRVEAAGYTGADFAAHSLRAGFLTNAAAAGASIWKMREVSRHKSVQVLSDYVRHVDLLKDHAGKDFL